jgi:hypothetical protein
MRQLNFLFNLFEIPFKKSNILKVALYDFSESTISRIEEFTINSRSINLENFTIFLTNLDDLNITESDVNKLVELMLKTSLKNLSNLDKVEIALKEIGRPAHYTEIGEKCNELFKDKFYSARAILSYLTREPQFSKDELPWVWTGARGVYALKEQGYKRPELSINDTVTEIIYNNYLLTKRPVPFQKILSEMTKYRDVFKESSLRIVCSFNEDIEQIGKDFYIPVEFSKDKNKELKESSINLDNLDKALEKYDK